MRRIKRITIEYEDNTQEAQQPASAYDKHMQRLAEQPCIARAFFEKARKPDGSPLDYAHISCPCPRCSTWC